MNARIPLAALALSLASTLAFAAPPAYPSATGAAKTEPAAATAAAPVKKQVVRHATKCKSDEVAVKGKCQAKPAS